jgi:leader peptidase (prepilin peptidase) / N-methyltransferase
MPPLVLSPLEGLVALWVFAIGTCIGSFLNVVIYRLPLGLSVNEPKRSFCPHCSKPIRLRHNIPILSWFLLGGRCADCGERIALRYPLVEFLTGALFLAVWLRVTPENPWLALPYFIFAAILVASTFIDLDHMIIPHELTWGGVAAGIVSSVALPQLMGQSSHLAGGLWSLLAAVAGYGLLWVVVEAGKIAFGRKRIMFDPPEKFSWKRVGDDDAELVVGGDVEKWSELFDRESDCLELICDKLEIGGRTFEKATLHGYHNRIEVGSASYPMRMLDTFSGVSREATIPREAMGLGDVNFLAAIGAFLGWQAILFTVAAASIVGSVFGLASLPFRERSHSIRLPFGPFLSIGALLWLFFGPALSMWYFSLFRS